MLWWICGGESTEGEMQPSEVVHFAREALGFLLQFLPHSQLRAMLDDEAVRRGHAIADAAEDVKFGPP